MKNPDKSFDFGDYGDPSLVSSIQVRLFLAGFSCGIFFALILYGCFLR